MRQAERKILVREETNIVRGSYLQLLGMWVKGLYKTKCYLGLYLSKSDSAGLYMIIQNYTRLCRTRQEFSVLYVTIQD